MMDNIRHLHKDRPAISAKVSRAFELLSDERQQVDVSKKNLLEALLTILEYCGDFQCQSYILEILLGKQDVIDYRDWFAQLWFKDMPNTIKAFVDLKSPDSVDNCNFLYIYNSELEMQFLYSVRCCLVSWNNTALPNPKKGAFWLHLNCGTKTLNVTGVEPIPLELKNRKVFSLRASEIRRVLTYNQVAPYGTKIQGICIHTTKGNLVVHPDPIILDWKHFSNFVNFVAKVKVEFKSMMMGEEHLDCNGNITTDSYGNNHEENSELEDNSVNESKASKNSGLVHTSLLQVSSSQNDSMRSAVHEDESEVQMGDESGNADIEVCEHFKQELLGGSCLQSPASVFDMNISKAVNVTVSSGTDANSSIELDSDNNVAAKTPLNVNITAAKTPLNVNITEETTPLNVNITAAKTPLNVNITEETTSNVNITAIKSDVTISAEAPTDEHRTTNENTLNEEAIHHSTPPLIENTVALDEASEEVSKTKPSRRFKFGRKPKPKCISKELSSTSSARRCFSKIKKLSFDETEKLQLDIPAAESPSIAPLAISTSRRSTRSYVKSLALQELPNQDLDQEKAEFKTPLEMPKSSRGRNLKQVTSRKRRSSVSLSIGTDVPVNVPAALPDTKNVEVYEALQNNLPKLPRLEDAENISIESTEVFQFSSPAPPDVSMTHPMSMPSLRTPLSTPRRDPFDESQADFANVPENVNTKRNSVLSTTACGPPPAPLHLDLGTFSVAHDDMHLALPAKLQSFDECVSHDQDWKADITEYNTCELGEIHMDSSSDASFLETPSAVLLSAPMTFKSTNDSVHARWQGGKFPAQDKTDMNNLQQLSEICCKFTHVN